VRSSVEEPILFLRTAVRIDGLKPFAGTPSEGAVMVKLPPCEPVTSFGSTNDLEDFAVLCRFDGGVAETWPGTHAQPGPFGVQHRDMASHGDLQADSGGDSGRFHGCQQRWIEPSGVKVLTSEVSELHGHAGRGVGMPFQASVPEILGDDPRLHKHLGDGRAEYVRTAVLEVEAEEAEADVVSCLCEVAAETVSDHGVGHGGHPRSLVSQEFTQCAERDLAWALVLFHAFQASALKVLNKLSIFFKGLGDGETNDLQTAVRLEGGQEGFINVVPRLGEVRGCLLLCLTRPESDQDHGQSQAPEDGNRDLVKHRVLGQSNFYDAIIA
jgi:hypothetical protein